MGSKNTEKHHHILPVKTALIIGSTLLVLTAVTVGVAKIDLGHLNFFIAMVVATIKALLVALFFMGLKYDHRENGMIFATSFIFLTIFMVLTSTDLFFRGDVYVKGPLVAAAQAKSKYQKPWISTPELVAHGKELFSVQCVSCHGAEGKGDGIAAPALNPRPRNFTETEGWKNGRKPTMVFKTLKEGIPGSAMASFATLPTDDRWALTQYVLSLAPKPQADTPADFAKIGIDPSKEGGGAKEDPTISVQLAMERMVVPETEAEANAQTYHAGFEQQVAAEGTGHRLYQQYCIQCHGMDGKGAIQVSSIGLHPGAYVKTAPFTASTEGLKSEQVFSDLVLQGLPGDLMPGVGHLSRTEVQELYRYVRGLAGP